MTEKEGYKKGQRKFLFLVVLSKKCAENFCFRFLSLSGYQLQMRGFLSFSFPLFISSSSLGKFTAKKSRKKAATNLILDRSFANRDRIKLEVLFARSLITQLLKVKFIRDQGSMTHYAILYIHYLVHVLHQIEATFEYELSSFDRILGQTRDVTEISFLLEMA